MSLVTTILHSTIFRNILTAVIVATQADVRTFLAWKNVSDIKTFSWTTLSIHILQGAAIGAAAGFGYNLTGLSS